MNGTARIRAWTLRRTRSSTIDSVGHSHALPTMLLTLLSICILGLVAGVAVVAKQAIDTDQRLTALEEYVAGRGAQRDRERDDLERQIQRALCDALDQLPTNPATDVLRDRYECGPSLAPGDPPSPEETVP